MPGTSTSSVMTPFSARSAAPYSRGWFARPICAMRSTTSRSMLCTLRGGWARFASARVVGSEGLRPKKRSKRPTHSHLDEGKERSGVLRARTWIWRNFLGREKKAQQGLDVDGDSEVPPGHVGA